ncbi:MAG: replication initiation factor domain-containing protein [Oscillospiraceae bacterium]|jgi:phage replication initiation protein|nr:replication initiation factor domain-containing protein [Oscillospiraceae bacterium]
MQAQILLDWLTFTLLTVNDPKKVIADIMGLDPDIFEPAEYGRNGYKSGLHYDNISILYDGGVLAMGVCVSLSGNGCRTYEQLGGNVLDLAFKVYDMERANITRLDIACDDKGGALDMDELERYYKERRIRSACRKRQFIQCDNGEYAPARTIYIGSRKSDLCFRFYDKAKEHYDPKADPDGYNSHWIRVEMQMRHEVAENAIRHIRDGMIKGQSLGECVAEMLGGHIQMIELDDSNISRCTVSQWWIDFLDTLNGVKITGKEEKGHIFERKLEWFNRSIVPLASALLGGIGERGMLELIYTGYDRRNKAQMNMLKVYNADPEAKGGLNLFGNRMMRKIYRQWRKRMRDKGLDMPVEPDRTWWDDFLDEDCPLPA